jgi:hypothetical protein
MGLNRNLGQLTEVITESGGNIGIGISPTLGKLQVTGGDGVSLAIKNTQATLTGSEFSQITLNNTSNAGANFESAKIKAVSTNGGANLSSLIFESSGLERMRIFSSGNLALGITNPPDNGSRLAIFLPNSSNTFFLNSPKKNHFCSFIGANFLLV